MNLAALVFAASVVSLEPDTTQMPPGLSEALIAAFYDFGLAHNGWMRTPVGTHLRSAEEAAADYLSLPAHQARTEFVHSIKLSNNGQTVSFRYGEWAGDKPIGGVVEKVEGKWRFSEWVGLNYAQSLSRTPQFGSSADVIRLAELSFGRLIRNYNLKPDQVFTFQDNSGVTKSEMNRESVGVTYSGKIVKDGEVIPTKMEASWNLFSGLLFEFKVYPVPDFDY